MKRYVSALQLALALLFSGVLIAQTQPTTSGLVGYWPFNEGTGLTAADGSPSGYTASLINSPGWSTAGREGHCLEMNDAQGRRAEAAGLSWQPTSFTVSFWLHPYALFNWGQQIGSGIGWGGFYFHTTVNGEVYVGTDMSTRMDPVLLKAGTVGAYRWQHFTFSYTFDNATGRGTGRFYKNGVLLAGKAGMTRPAAWGGFRMGGTDSQGALFGRLDEVRVYNRALSDPEVKELAAWPAGPAGSTWNPAATTTEWNNNANWLEGYAPHAATEEVGINACTICPRLAANTTVKAFVINGGGLDLNGYLLSVTGIANFNRGTVSSGNPAGSSLAATGLITTFGNSSGGAVMEVPVTINSHVVTFSYSHFKEPVTVTRIGTGTDVSTGGNVFWKTLSITNAGKGMQLARYTRDIYEGDVTFSLTGNTDCNISLAYTAQNLFKGNITLSSPARNVTGWTGIFFEGQAPDCAIIKEGGQIKIAPAGFSIGNLTLKGLTQEGATPQAIELTGNTTFYIGPNATFNGPVNFKSVNFFLNGATYNRKAYLEKNGGFHNACSGNNIFNGPLHFKMNSGRWVAMGRSTRDVFNDTLLVENVGWGDGYLTFSDGSIGNQFNGHVLLSYTGPTGYCGIGFGSGTSLLAEGKTIQIAPAGFTHGTLTLQNIRQTGNAPHRLLLTGQALIRLMGNNQFNGPVEVTSPRIWLDGGTYGQAASFTKTGSSLDNCRGGNVFRGKLTIRNQGPAGSAINMATQANDQFLLPPPAPNP